VVHCLEVDMGSLSTVYLASKRPENKSLEASNDGLVQQIQRDDRLVQQIQGFQETFFESKVG